MADKELIPSVGWSPDVQGNPTIDNMGHGNGVPIEGNKVVLTVDVPTSDSHIINGVGWNPRG